jgi:hypothetical protein
MTANDKLSAFLAADQAPAFDPAFIAQLEDRMARLRLLGQLRRTAVWAIAIAAIGYGLYAASGLSVLADAFGFAGDIARSPALMLAAITVAAGIWLPRFLPRRLVR